MKEPCVYLKKFLEYLVISQILFYIRIIIRPTKKVHQEYLYIRGMPTELPAQATVDK